MKIFSDDGKLTPQGISLTTSERKKMENYYRNLMVMSLINTLGFPRVIVAVRHLLHMGLQEARALVMEINDSHYLETGGDLMFFDGKTLFVETGDRTRAVTYEFFESCSPEMRLQIDRAEEKFSLTSLQRKGM